MFRPRRWAIACSLLLMTALPARAVDLPAGTKNFTPPGSTPSYFSNEVGAMQGRGTGQRAESPRVAQPNIVYHSQGRRVAMTVRGSRLVEVRRKGRGRHGRAVAMSGRRAASAGVSRAVSHRRAVTSARRGASAVGRSRR